MSKAVFTCLLLVPVLFTVPLSARAQAESNTSKSNSSGTEEYKLRPERRQFFNTIKQSMAGRMDDADACANAKEGMKLAASLTRDSTAYKSERHMKEGYLMEDFSTWAFRQLVKSCETESMKPLVEDLIKAETAASKADEPVLSFSYLSAADFYLNRCNDKQRAEYFFDQAAKAIPKVYYEETQSYIPESFAHSLAVYEEMLSRQASKAGKYKQIRNLRIQQEARHINNVGNAYLKGVFGPPAKTGLRQYEVDHAVEAYTKAIEMIPSWAEPYRGRARAYELLEKHDLAKRDRAKAKELESSKYNQ